MREGVNKREVESQSSELLGSQKELQQLKDGILGKEKLSKEKQKPLSLTPEEILKELQSVDKSIFEQPKVILGGSLYNNISKSDFKEGQGIPLFLQKGKNIDGTYKYQLKTRGETTNFDYDPKTKLYYVMPAEQPKNKIETLISTDIIKLVERLNFAKYRLNFAKYQAQQIKNYKHPSAVDAVVTTEYKFKFVGDEVSIRREGHNKAGAQIKDGIDYLFNINEIFGFERDEINISSIGAQQKILSYLNRWKDAN